MIPRTTSELDLVLGRMQKNGAPKDVMQKVLDAYKSQKQKLAAQSPTVSMVSGLADEVTNPAPEKAVTPAGRSTGIPRPEGEVTQGEIRPEVPEEEKGYFTKIKEGIGEGIQKGYALDKANEKLFEGKNLTGAAGALEDASAVIPKTIMKGVTKIGLPIVEGVAAALDPVIETALDVPLPMAMSTRKDGFEYFVTPREYFSEVSGEIPDSVKEAGKQKIMEINDWYQGQPDNIKTALKDTGAIGQVIATLLGGKAVAEGVKPLAEAGVKTAQEGLYKLSPFYENSKAVLNDTKLSKIESALGEAIDKGIKPGLSGGKKTIGGLEKWKSDAVSAVKTIVANKGNLKLVDEFGDAVEGVPQNLKQFSDAIQQTKKSIFDNYSALTEKAGGTGVMVDLNKITSELEKVASNKVLQTQKPEIISYVKSKIDLLKDVTYSPQEAEEAVKVLNQSLESFYRNPSYDTASKAYVDSLVVNNLRKELDDTIASATGKEYQALKNQYSTLKSIEKDVVHRTLVDARKNVKGLIDFTDIFSGGEVVGGLLSMNPTMVAKGVFQKGIKEYFKFLNDPNTQIKKVFQKAEESAVLK